VVISVDRCAEIRIKWTLKLRGFQQCNQLRQILEEGCRKARLGVRASSTLPWIRLTFSVYPRKLMYPLPTTPLLSYELHHSFLVSLNLREVESFSGGFTVSVPEILANSGYGFRDVNDAAR